MGRYSGIGFLVLCFFTREVFASHAVSADISYRCLGSNQYRITLNFYRDCAGANAPSAPSITFKSVSCGYNFSRTLTLQSSDEVEMLCPGQQSNSTCGGGALPGIQQYIYARTITLPAQCSDWVISYDLCCRNAAVTNLYDPGNQDLYIETRLNNAGGLCNNSPVFTTLPVPYLCTGQQVSYNHGAVDADGDSLVYTSINPLDDPSVNIPYTSIYNPNHPMSLSGGFTLNQQTGQMIFTPSASQNAVITIRVHEYRNGVLIGSTMRDMQFVIIACGNTLPVASGVNGTGTYTATFCSGRSNCFTINTSDANAAQSVTLTWNNAIPGAAFTTTGASRPTGTLCWTPGLASVGSHSFLATVQDNACPLFGHNTYAYTINVEPSPSVNMGSTPVSCFGRSDATATATATGGSGTYTYLWNTTPAQTAPTATGLPAGTYIVTVTDASLSPQCGMVIDTIVITQPSAVAANPTVNNTTCGSNNGSISLAPSGGHGGAYSYLWNNGSISGSRSSLASGTYSFTVTDVAGCTMSSSVNVAASTAPSLSVTKNNATCFGVSNGSINLTVSGGTAPYAYLWSGGSTAQNRTNLAAGTYTVTVTSLGGCTDAETISITQPAAIPNTVLPVAICAGESHYAGGTNRMVAGTYFDTYSSAHGCDSVVETHLSVLPNASFQQSFSVCSGDGVFAGTSYYSAAGTYYDTLVAANGCDSIVETQLTVFDHDFEVQSRTICNGDNTTVGSSVYTAAGTYFDTLANSNGCDSVIQTNLVVLPVYFETVSPAICAGESFAVGSSVYTSAGSYVDTLVANTGCDSIVSTTITILNHFSTSLTPAICSGESFVVGSSIYTVAGNYTDTFTAANGCDSVVQTSLTVLPILNTVLNPSICAGDSFTAGSSVYTIAGTYYDTLQSSLGCDSIITTNLTVFATHFQTQNRTICNGDNITVGSSVYTTAGTYLDTLANSNGCDSVIQTNLVVFPVYFETVSAAICAGESFAVGSSVYTAAGSYYDTLSANTGCDSVVFTTITILNHSSTSLTPAICSGESFVVGSSIYTVAGSYADTFTAANGCDSVVQTTLSVLPILNTVHNPSICSGGSFTTGSSVYTTPGTYYDTLQSSFGCDSIVRTNLTVFATHFQTQNRTICNGDSITVGSSVYSAAGTYLDTLANSNGCDSVIQTNLVVMPVYFETVNEAICSGEAFVVGSSVYGAAGSYYDTLSANTGCDSVVFTTIAILNHSFTLLDTSICAGESFVVGSSIYTVAGSYTDTFTAANGCDSVVQTTLSVLPILNTVHNPSICAGDSFTAGSSVYTIAGTYYDTLQSSLGCDSIITTNLTVFATHFQTQNRTICNGDNITVGSSVYSAAGTYLDTLANSNGCDSVIQTNLVVLPVYFETVNAAICSGEAFVVGSSVYAAAGSYYDTLSANTGCDSVVFTTIAILNHSFTLLDTSICSGESFVVGSSIYTVAGSYTDTFTAANGCDSVVQTSLTVLPILNTVLNPSICAGDSFTAGSSVYTIAGTYYDTLQSSFGCDSIITTNLTVFATHFQTQNRTICNGDNITVGSSVYVAAGTYLDTLINSNGCDSVIQTNLVVLPVYFETVSVAICAGESFAVGGSVYTAAGSYYDTLVANTGCDSIVFTNLAVLNNASTMNPVSICLGSSTAVGGSVYTAAGAYTDTLTAANGCDSVVHTTLIVHQPEDTLLNVSICSGEIFTVGSSVYQTAGTYYDTLQSVFGCDSAIQTNLVVLDTQFQVLNKVICSYDSMVVGNSVYSTIGTYFDTLANGNNCDSVIQTNLIVLPDFITVLNTTICAGDTFKVGTSTYTTAGSYYDTLLASINCDSIVFTTVSVISNPVTHLNRTICFGESTAIGASVYDTAGIYLDTLMAANGCDSVVQTQLSILPVKDTLLNASICNGGVFMVGSSAYTAAGNYVDTLQSSIGCDSIIHTQVTIRGTQYQNQNRVVCSGESITVGNSVYNNIGTFIDTLLNSNNCDSVIQTNLVVLPDFITVLNPIICEGDTFRIGSSAYTVSGSYYDTLTASVNCDSIVFTVVTVLNNPVTNLDLAICFGESVTIGSSVYSTSGIYLDTLPASNGCDSVVHTRLTVFPVRDTMLVVSICMGETFVVGNSTYALSGNYFDTLQSSYGCDSVIQTLLTLHSTHFQIQSQILCAGDSIIVGASVYQQTGAYIDTLVNVNGCDSIIQTNLTILTNSITAVYATLCRGESFVNGSSVYAVSGSYYDTFTSAFGCDSVVISILTVLDTAHTSINAALCLGDGITVGSSFYNTAGSYSDTLTAFNGCDSVVHTVLTILPIRDTTLNVTLCFGDTFPVGGSRHGTAGTYIDTLQSSFGCDSIVYTNLQILPVFSATIDSIICLGGVVSVGASNYDAPGNYTDTLIATNGCDSVVTLNLIVHAPQTTSVSATICYGDTFHAGNSAYHQSGTYTDSLIDRFGCDSLIQSSVTVLPLNYRRIGVAVCDGESFSVGNSTYGITGVYHDTLSDTRGCDSIVELHLLVLLKSYSSQNVVICQGEDYVIGNSLYTEAGIYTDTFLAANGCDSIVTTQLTVNPIRFTTIDTSLCMGESLTVGTSNYGTTGIYYDTLLTGHGCDSVIRTQLFVFPVINGAHDRFICKGDSIQFKLSGGVQYEWLPATGLSCSSCSDPVAHLTNDITYAVKVTDANGCIGNDLIHVRVGYMEVRIGASDSVVCEDLPVQFAGGFNSHVASVSMYWNFDDGTHSTRLSPSHTFSDSGIYQTELFAMSADGCSAQQTVTIRVMEKPALVLTADTAVCFGESLQLLVYGAASYEWSPPLYLDSVHSSTPVATPVTTLQYRVTGTNADGCTDFGNVIVTVHPLPVVEASPDEAICPYSQTALSVRGGTSYRWYPLNGLNDSTLQSVIASPNTSTTYFVEVANAFGCTAMDSIYVEVYPETQLRLSASGDLCLGETMELSAEGAERYSWYPPIGLSCDTCENLAANPNSNMVYQVEATDVYGCVYTDSVAIAVRANPEVSSIGDLTICKGESITLQTYIPPGTEHIWTPGRYLDDIAKVSPVATPDYSSSFVIAVSNSYGCHSTDTVHVNVIEEVSAALKGDDGLCLGESAHLEIEIEEASANGYSIAWTPASLFKGQDPDNPVIAPQENVEVTAIITSKTCKADTITFPIEVFELPDVYAGEDQVVYAGEKIHLSASTDNIIAEYQWAPAAGLDCPDCRSTNWVADGSKRFTIDIVDENGCAAKDTVIMRVMGGCREDIFIPNAFSPNGDERNDKFLIRTINPVRLEYFKIFDRWGAQVYSSSDATEGWDGTHPNGWNGFYENNIASSNQPVRDDVIPGVYVYMLKAVCRTGEPVILNGNVTLIR